MHTATHQSEITQLQEIFARAIFNIKSASRQYLTDAQSLWEEAGKNLSSTIGADNITLYSIHCSRIMEIAGFLYFLEAERVEKDKTISFLFDFMSNEPGCAHISSDYYAASLVLPILSLCSSGHRDIAELTLRNSAVWLCDRYQKGFGLAEIFAEPYEEIAMLVGYPFDFIKIQPRIGSFAASILCDLAALVENKLLYENIVNDIKASKIVPEYWQIPDTTSLFTLEGEDIVTYPRIDYNDTLLSFESFSFANHVKSEVRSYKIMDYVGPLGPFFMMVLLRDRYFPTLWPLFLRRV